MREKIGHWHLEVIRLGRAWVGRAEWRGPGMVTTRYTEPQRGHGSKRQAFKEIQRQIELWPSPEDPPF